MNSARQAVVLLSHIETPMIARHFARLRRETSGLIDAFFCLHQPQPVPEMTANAAVDLVITARDGAHLLPHRESERRRGGRPFNRGFNDLIWMPAYLHPQLTGYDYLWIVEYDVDFAGDWRRFFARTMQSRADLLSASILPRVQCPQWANWPGFDCPPEVSSDCQLRMFAPVTRLSRAMRDSYVQSMRESRWRGHFEAVVPTIARHHGLRIEDLGGNGPFCPPAWRFMNYSHTPVTHIQNALCGSRATFVFRPVTHTAYFEDAPEEFDQPDFLYHPVKVGRQRHGQHAQPREAPLLEPKSVSSPRK